MDSRQAIKLAIDMGALVGLGYLEDLSDDELFHRPGPGCNHINWQVGHLVAGEHRLLSAVAPGLAAPLPAGFAERYTAETAGSDDRAAFCTKAELLAAHQAQRTASLAALEAQSDADFDRDSGFPYAPTVGAIFSLLGSHWLMHAGQWAVVRRQLGRAPMF